MVTGSTWWRSISAVAASAAAAVVAAALESRATDPYICTGAAFLALPTAPLGTSPLTIKTLVQDNQVCLAFALAPVAARDAAWFAVGLSSTPEIVTTSLTSVMLFQAATGSLAAYVLTDRAPSAVVKRSDQSGYAIASMSLSTRSFSYQRTLPAATASDVAINVSQDMYFIWAYGASWSTDGHLPDTSGIATYRFTLPGASATADKTGHRTSAVAAVSPPTVAPKSPPHENITGDAAFPLDRHNNRTDTTVLRAREPLCNGERNCPAIIGGATALLVLVSGFVATQVICRTSLGQMLRFQTVIAPPPVRTASRTKYAALRGVELNPCAMFYQVLGDLYIGEALVVLTLLGAVAALIALNVDAHASPQSTTGQVALLVLLFVLLPVARVPLWSLFFRSSFERIVKFHRWLGMALTIAVVVHLILALDVTRVTQTDKYGSVTPLYGFVAFVAFAAMALLANEVVRRVAFEVFYLSHRVLSVVGLVFTILHAPKMIGVALAVPLALYGAGVALQWTLSLTSTVQANIAPVFAHGAVAATTLVLRPTKQTEALAARVRPGSFFWLKLPSVSRTQWHPFSAVVTREGKSVGFCVRAVGAPSSFTQKLAIEAQKKRVVPVSLCGPFGSLALDLDEYDTVVLIAGGVGITPIANLVNQRRLRRQQTSKANATQHWRVVWSVKSAEHLLMIDEFLSPQLESPVPSTGEHGLSVSGTPPGAAPATGAAAVSPLRLSVDESLHLTWSLHVSTVKLDSSITRQTGERLQFQAGRPVLQHAISTECFKTGGRVAVLACGPPILVAEAQALARACGVAFHKEVFQW